MVSTRPEVPPVIRIRKLKKNVRTTETELLIRRRTIAPSTGSFLPSKYAGILELAGQQAALGGDRHLS